MQFIGCIVLHTYIYTIFGVHCLTNYTIKL